MASLAKPKVLVLFYSRTGTTRHLAESIARALHADLEELRESRSRSGVLGWLRCGYDGAHHRSSETLPLQHELADYDLIVVGSPTWNGALSSPVRGFLERNRQRLPKVALFATCARDGSAKVLAEMAELLPSPPVATLGMLENDVKHGPAVWVGELAEAALTALESESAQARGAQRVAGSVIRHHGSQP